jgi:hypothetical protein
VLSWRWCSPADGLLKSGDLVARSKAIQIHELRRHGSVRPPQTALAMSSGYGYLSVGALRPPVRRWHSARRQPARPPTPTRPGATRARDRPHPVPEDPPRRGAQFHRGGCTSASPRTPIRARMAKLQATRALTHLAGWKHPTFARVSAGAARQTSPRGDLPKGKIEQRLPKYRRPLNCGQEDDRPSRWDTRQSKAAAGDALRGGLSSDGT